MIIFGPGGVGKSKLASLIRDINIKPLFIDIEQGTNFLDVDRISNIETFSELRSVLQNQELTANYGAIVIDGLTKAEEMANAHTIETVKKQVRGGSEVSVKSLEEYGWGDGFGYAYSTFLTLLGDLDALVRQGKWVIGICHDCVATVPNPNGEDYIRYEPRLMTTRTVSTRLRVREWADHLCYINFDVYVKEGERKGKGTGTRTIYPTEQPTHMAKSRSLANPIPYPDGSSDFWKLLSGVQA